MVGMELEVAGIGRIAEAHIRLDGVTVIAGENNTGKSTIGKAALALIDGRFDLDRRMTDATRRAIRQAVQSGMIPSDEGETWAQRRQMIIQAEKQTDRFMESTDMDVEDFITALHSEGIRMQDVNAVRAQIEAAVNMRLTEYAASQIDLRLSSLFDEDALSRVDGYGKGHRLALHTDDGAVTSMSWDMPDDHVFDGDSFAGPNAVWVDTPALIENLAGVSSHAWYGRLREDDRHVAIQAIMDAAHNAIVEEWQPDDRVLEVARAIAYIVIDGERNGLRGAGNPVGARIRATAVDYAAFPELRGYLFDEIHIVDEQRFRMNILPQMAPDPDGWEYTVSSRQEPDQ